MTIDVFLAVLTNGRVTGDEVAAHTDLLAGFPYLGPPHRQLPCEVRNTECANVA